MTVLDKFKNRSIARAVLDDRRARRLELSVQLEAALAAEDQAEADASTASAEFAAALEPGRLYGPFPGDVFALAPADGSPALELVPIDPAEGPEDPAPEDPEDPTPEVPAPEVPDDPGPALLRRAYARSAN